MDEQRSLEILNSFECLLGRPLLPGMSVADHDPETLACVLREASFVVVAHGVQADPILNYANHAALRLWETDRKTLLAMPSRKTAEPMHRDERAEMLRRTEEQGYIDDYQGIRISATGKRFFIEQAIVWNVVDAHNEPAGQAATFSQWTMLEEAE